MENVKDYELDDLDVAIILAIGKKWNSNRKTQKIALEISKLLGLKIECIDSYCEDIVERLNSGSRMPFWVKMNYRYMLTKLGRIAYDFLVQKLKEKKREDILKILNLA